MTAPSWDAQMKYGDGEIALPFDAFRSIERIKRRTVFVPPSPTDLIRAALARPVGSPPLRSLLSPGERVCIAVSDVTRYSATDIFLPLLLEETDAAGIPRHDVVVAIARGTHRLMTADEIRQALGDSIDTGIEVIQSDPDGETTDFGTTTAGTPVKVDVRVAACAKIVLTGTISFHYFAGFGGGRKALVPGCAARETAKATHFRIFRSDGPGKHQFARSGILAGNPVHEDIVEAVSMVKPVFLFNTLLMPDKRIFDVVAGHWRKGHEEACGRYSRVFRIPLPRRYPVVVASAGGWPKDINIIQAHKAFDHAFRAVEPGGVLILLAECRDGFGSSRFFPWFRFTDPDTLETALRADYEIYGQTAHAVLSKTRACKAILVSSLSSDDATAMGFIPATTLDEAIAKAKSILGVETLPQTLALPDAGFILPDPPQ